MHTQKVNSQKTENQHRHKHIDHPLYRTQKIRHGYFSTKNMKKHPERMVLIGFIAADGCVTMKKSKAKTYPYLCFNICAKDRIILDRINKELCLGSRLLSYNKATKSFMFYIPSEQMCADLSRYNIVPRKTPIFVPPSLSRKDMALFLRGFFYGDGCVSGKGSARVYILTGNVHCCTFIRDFLVKNKIVTHCRMYKAGKTDLYKNLVMSGSYGIKFAKFIFADRRFVLLPRKHFIPNDWP